MTTSMIITLAIIILMIVVIISDKLPIGAPALLAAALLVVCNQTDLATAFSGFTDKNVIMIMGFMICTAALQKTRAIYDLQGMLGRIAAKGSMLGFAVLILAIMAIGNFITGTAYYVLVISIIATIPYNTKLPNSRILLPAAFASGMGGWMPNSVVFFSGLVASIVSKVGGGDVTISIGRFCLMNIIWSAIYLVWAVVGSKLLPNRDIAGAANGEALPERKEFVPVLSDLQQTIVYVGYAAMIVSMIFLNKLPGEAGYAMPTAIAGVFLCVGALNFKEFLGSMFSPVMVMMASVIGVAATMANSGLSGFLGEKIAGMLGGSPSLMFLVFAFALMTSVSATLTGASIGSLFIFAPIGIALCMQFGYSPIPLALACVKAAWINWFLPIDGLPALAMGTGKYKLTEFWKFILPLWIMMLAFTSVMCVVFFG